MVRTHFQPRSSFQQDSSHSGRPQTVLERLSAPSMGPSSPQIAAPMDPLMGRKISLTVVVPEEDIPRVIKGYFKVGKCEGVLVLRPHEGQSLLVLTQEGRAWTWVGLSSDIPQHAQTPAAIEEATKLATESQKELAPKGPVSLRVSWSAQLEYENGHPKVTLIRKIASYGTLIVTSDPFAGEWKWKVERKQVWYATPSVNDGAAPTLTVAIKQGLASAYGLLGEACAVRDTHRRQAFDPEYAQTHPIRFRAEPRDPIQRFNPKPAPVPVQKPTEAAPPTTPTRRGRPRKSDAPAPVDIPVAATPQPAAKRGRKPKNPVMPAPPVVTDPYSNVFPPPPPPPLEMPQQPALNTQATPPVPAPYQPPPKDEAVDPEKDLVLLKAFESVLGTQLSNMAKK